MKRILILGTSNVQKDAVDACHALGLEVFTCSNTGSGPAARAADHSARIDIAADEAVRQYAEASQVDWIYSVGSDLAMPTACRVSTELGLPTFISPRTAETCHSKPRLRAALGPEFPGNLRYQVLSEPAAGLVNLVYPCMIKPSDSQGGRGVSRLDSPANLPAAFQAAERFSTEKSVILEEFVPGPEVSANLYLVDGVVLFYAVSERRIWPQFSSGIVRSHHFPAGVVDEAAQARILKMTQSACRLLGIANGPAYFQIKLNGGQPFLIEASPRLDGCHLWRLIEYSTGVDLLRITLEHLVGSPPRPEQLIPTRCQTARLEFDSQRPGQSAIARPVPASAFYHEDYYHPGEVVRPVNGLLEKVGYSIFRDDPA